MNFSNFRGRDNINRELDDSILVVTCKSLLSLINHQKSTKLSLVSWLEKWYLYCPCLLKLTDHKQDKNLSIKIL